MLEAEFQYSMGDTVKALPGCLWTPFRGTKFNFYFGVFIKDAEQEGERAFSEDT